MNKVLQLLKISEAFSSKLTRADYCSGKIVSKTGDAIKEKSFHPDVIKALSHHGEVRKVARSIEFTSLTHARDVKMQGVTYSSTHLDKIDYTGAAHDQYLSNAPVVKISMKTTNKLGMHWKGGLPNSNSAAATNIDNLAKTEMAKRLRGIGNSSYKVTDQSGKIKNVPEDPSN